MKQVSKQVNVYIATQTKSKMFDNLKLHDNAAY